MASSEIVCGRRGRGNGHRGSRYLHRHHEQGEAYGKIFIDYLRNDYTATAIADYGVRARPGAPVALPLDWKELKSLKSASQFTMKDVLERLKNRKTGAISEHEGQTLPSQ